MPQFYFHVRQNNVLYEDRRGGEFADVKSAWSWAEADARAMIREGQLSRPEQCWIEICDLTGTPVVSLPLLRVAH